MSYDSMDGEDYLSDGIYWSWWHEDKHNKNIETSEDKPGDKIREELLDLENRRRILVLSLKAESTKDFRQILFNNMLGNGLKRMAFRYCNYECLPNEYGEVALQKNVLVDVIEQHMKKLDIFLCHSEIKELNELIIQVYNNNTKNIYTRVGEIQLYVHSKAKIYFGHNGEVNLNSDTMRKLLSFSRLHLNISDLKKGNIEFVMNELKLNIQERKDLSGAIPNYLLKAGKNHVKNWKARHLRSILFFATIPERSLLQNLLKIDVSISIDDFIKQLMEGWSEYAYE